MLTEINKCGETVTQVKIFWQLLMFPLSLFKANSRILRFHGHYKQAETAVLCGSEKDAWLGKTVTQKTI